MGKLASIVLNWIGGGKTPIPIRFLKSVDVPGNAPNSGNNNIHILEVKGGLDYTTDEELFKEKLFLDDKPFEQSDINKIHIYDTVVKYYFGYYAISYLDHTNNAYHNSIMIVAGYDSQSLDSTSNIKIVVNYSNDDGQHSSEFEIKLVDE